MTAANEGSNPFDPPNSIADCGFQIAEFILVPVNDCVLDYANQQFPFSNPKSPGNCGREVRHLVVSQADDGSSPFGSANSGQAIPSA